MTANSNVLPGLHGSPLKVYRSGVGKIQNISQQIKKLQSKLIEYFSCNSKNGTQSTEMFMCKLKSELEKYWNVHLAMSRSVPHMHEISNNLGVFKINKDDIIIINYYLFKVDDIAKILHAQKMYIKLSNTRIWYAN